MSEKAESKTPEPVAIPVPRLKSRYREELVPAMVKEFGYDNVMQIPGLVKIVVNMGVGEAVNDTKKVKAAAADLEKIAGQKPVITHARKSIATFKVRENMPLGGRVTLRRDTIRGAALKPVVKTLVADEKWMGALAADVQSELHRVSQTLTARILELAERYKSTLPELVHEVEALASSVDEHLRRMGAVWS